MPGILMNNEEVLAVKNRLERAVHVEVHSKDTIHAHEKGWLTVHIEFDVVRRIMEEIRGEKDE